MKAKLIVALPLVLVMLGVLGCGQQVEVTEEDKANIDRLVREGIGPAPQDTGAQEQWAPASGAVEPP